MLTDFAKVVFGSSTGYLILMLCIQVCLHLGFKILWNVMSLVQFLFYMHIWYFGIPAKARVFFQ